MADGFLLDVDTSKLREADNYFKSMVSNAEKLQTALKGALGDPKAFAAVNILERVKSFMTEIGDTRLSPKVDTKRLEEFSSEMSNIVDMMQVMSQQKGIQFFDTKSVRDMEDNALRIQTNINDLDDKIQKLEYEYQHKVGFEAPINRRTGKPFGENTKTHERALKAWEDEKWLQIKIKEEERRGYLEDLRLAKMTEDEKLQYVMKNIAKESAEKQKEINSQRARYKTLLSEQLDIQKKIEQAGKYGDLGEEGQKTIDEYNRQFEIRDKERRKIEEDYAVFVVDLTENAQRKMLDANLKRIKQEQEAQQLAYRTSAQGALEYAGKASTINEMKDAQKYLQRARDKVDVSDKETIDKLNDAYTRLRATIESLTTAEKNEQSLQPSLRNEYIRLRKELDANREAQEKFANLKDGNTEYQAALVAREQDLQNQILSIKQNAGALLDETDRKYEAEKSRRAIELAEKTEAQKAEIAKRRMQEAIEQEKKTGVMSSDKALWRIDFLKNNVQNAAQAEMAIKSLENAKKRLDNTDSRYEETIKDLNSAIAQHKQTIEQTKPVVEAVARVSANEALNNAKSARTMQELRQALKDLKQSREELDIDDDASKINEIGDAINNVSGKLDELEGKQKKVKKNNNDLVSTFKKLKGVATAWLGLNALKDYALKVVNIREEYEKQIKSLQIILQNKDEANKIWQQTKDLALVSPFSLRELIGYTKQMAAYRIETDKLHKTTKMLADVSAGVGVDMQRLILAFGQVRAASFLRATELRQFTEAGVPLLEELSATLSEVHGRFLSVGDVMDMISKRQVSFKNVEEVFNKMTSSGGVFYKMQEQQAQTIFGLRSNLKDAIDLMFNDIGKSNEGFIKYVLKGITEIVKNWRNFADLVGVTATMFMTGSLGAGIGKLINGIIKATNEAKTLRAVLSSIGKVGWGAIIGAVIGLIAYLALAKTEADKLMQEFGYIDKELKEDLIEAQNGFSELASIIRSVTTTYVEKNRALEEMKRRYGDILPDMMLEMEYIKNMGDGYGEALAAMKTYYNAKARAQKEDLVNSEFAEKYRKTVNDVMRTLDMARYQWSEERDGKLYSYRMSIYDMFDADKNTVTRMVSQILTEMEDGVVEADSMYEELLDRLAKYYSKEDVREKTFKTYYNAVAAVSKIAQEYIDEKETAMSSVSGLPFETAHDEDLYKLHQLEQEDMERYLSLVKQLRTTYEEAYDLKKSLNDGSFQGDAKAAEAAIKGITDVLTDLYVKMGVKAPTDFFDGIATSAYTIDEEIERVTASIYNRFINRLSNDPNDSPLAAKMVKDVTKSLQKLEGGELKEAIGNLMKSVAGENNLHIFDNILYDESLSLKDYANSVGAELERMEEYLKEYERAKKEAKTDSEKADVDSAFVLSDIEKYKQALPYFKRLATLLGYVKKQKGGGGGTNSIYDERIKVIDDMVKKYEELRKLFGEDEAISGAFEAYKDAFADAYKDISWVDKNVKTMTPEQFVEKVLNFPDKNKIVEFLDKLSKEEMKAFEKIKVELAKGEYVYEMRVDSKLESDKDLTKKIESMFEDYEISLEVQKMGLSAFDAKDMFNLDVLNLEQLKQQLRDAHSEFIGKDKEEEYKEFFARIYKLEEKQRIEQMKKYSKYLSDSMTERVKLKKEELAQLAELEKLSFTDEQKALIRNSIQKESQDKMNKLDWEEFKNSDMYIRIFQDIDGASTKTLKNMRAKLVEMKSQLKNLDPKEVKSIVSEIEKIDEDLAKKNPFKTAITGLDDYIKAVKNAKEIENKYLEGQQKEDDIEQQVKLVSNMLGAEQANLENMNKSGNATELDISLQQIKIQQLQQQLLLLQQQLKKQKEINEANGQALQQNENTKKEFKDSLKDVGAQISSAASALPQVAADLEHVFGAMDAGTKDTVESISEIGGGIGNAITGFASGNYIQGITGVTQAIGGAFAIGDKKKERAIQREIEKVKDLQREYEKLEEVISYSYNIDEINSNYGAAKKNLEDQIKSTQEMRRLEEDKKKTDQAKIKEYTQQIEDYQKQLQELEYERINQLGGIAGGDAIKSASENFVNAWIDAFKETGDGLSGLEEQFDEVFMNLVKKQVLGRGVDKMLEPLFANLEGMLYDGAMDAQEYEDFNKQWNSLSPQINEFLTKMVNDLGIADDITKKTGELSGLQSGIQGITEDQADILAAYWSSVRFIVSNIEQKFTEYARQMLGSDANANPILGELKEHTRILNDIDDKLGSIIGYSGGAHVKTYLMSQ